MYARNIKEVFATIAIKRRQQHQQPKLQQRRPCFKQGDLLYTNNSGKQTINNYYWLLK